MIETTITILNKDGLHMRPSMLLSDTADGFDSTITLSKGGLEVSAKSIMEVAMLAATQGSEIIVKAEGDDEQEAIEAIVEVAANGFEAAYVEK